MTIFTSIHLKSPSSPEISKCLRAKISKESYIPTRSSENTKYINTEREGRRVHESDKRRAREEESDKRDSERDERG